MRVLFVYPNANRELIGWGDLGAIAEPLALEYLSAVARAAGHEVKLLDLRLFPSLLEMMLATYEPDVVAVTGYSMHVLRNLEVCAAAKRQNPACITVVGGHHATLLPIDYSTADVDYVVSGEGTRAFEAILRDVERGERNPIAGVLARSGAAFVSGGAAQEIDIDAIPFPDRALAPSDRDSYFIDWMKPIALMRTTVGCPYRCSFCSLWRIMDGKYYKRDVDRVLEELAQIDERFVFLVDDEPFVNPKRMHELADALLESSIDKEFFAYCRIDSFLRDADLMRKWHSAGLRRVFFGIETIFEDELKEYNKRQELEQIVRGLESAREIGIGVFANFIIHPHYTEYQFDEVIRFIERCNVDYPSFTIWTPIPGIGLDDDYSAIIDKQPNGRPNWPNYDLQHPVIRTTLPLQTFMDRYNGLFRVFSSRYAAVNPPTVGAHADA